MGKKKQKDNGNNKNISDIGEQDMESSINFKYSKVPSFEGGEVPVSSNVELEKTKKEIATKFEKKDVWDQGEVKSLKEENLRLVKENNAYKLLVDMKEKEITELHNAINERDSLIDEQEKAVIELTTSKDNLILESTNKDLQLLQIPTLLKQIQQREEEVFQKEQTIQKKDLEIFEKNQEVNELKTMKKFDYDMSVELQNTVAKLQKDLLNAQQAKQAQDLEIQQIKNKNQLQKVQIDMLQNQLEHQKEVDIQQILQLQNQVQQLQNVQNAPPPPPPQPIPGQLTPFQIQTLQQQVPNLQIQMQNLQNQIQQLQQPIPGLLPLQQQQTQTQQLLAAQQRIQRLQARVQQLQHGNIQVPPLPPAPQNLPPQGPLAPQQEVEVKRNDAIKKGMF